MWYLFILFTSTQFLTSKTVEEKKAKVRKVYYVDQKTIINNSKKIKELQSKLEAYEAKVQNYFASKSKHIEQMKSVDPKFDFEHEQYQLQMSMMKIQQNVSENTEQLERILEGFIKHEIKEFCIANKISCVKNMTISDVYFYIDDEVLKEKYEDLTHIIIKKLDEKFKFELKLATLQ